MRWQIATIVEIREENPGVKTYVFELADWREFLPGQHFKLRLTAPDGYQTQRSYSIASSPVKRGLVELTIEKLEDGEVSAFMHDIAEVGDQIELLGPIGGYFVWKSALAKPLLLIAGGSGVVPLMSMLRHREALKKEVSTQLLFSIKSPDHLIYGSELDQMNQNDPDLQVRYTYTRSTPENWTGYQRRIDKEMLVEILKNFHETPMCYVCGPTPLVEFVANALVDLGVAPVQIRTERFGPSGN